MKYTEHEKLKKISDKSQAIGDFIEWLSHEKGLTLGKSHSHEESNCELSPGCRHIYECGYAEDQFQLNWIPITDLLAEYFDIDQKRLEKEKRHMLDEIRRVSA